MTTIDAPLDAGPVADRNARLASAVRSLRTRGGDGSLDVWLLRIGGALLPLGALVVLLGWYGASHTPRLFEQIPYLISGGLLGVALVFAGGFLYFAYWLTVIVRDDRAQAERTQQTLERIEALLAEGATAAAAPVETSVAAPGPSTFVATRNGSMLHTPDCPVVANRDNLRRVDADTPGYTPCRICTPL